MLEFFIFYWHMNFSRYEVIHNIPSSGCKIKQPQVDFVPEWWVGYFLTAANETVSRIWEVSNSSIKIGLFKQEYYLLQLFMKRTLPSLMK